MTTVPRCLRLAFTGLSLLGCSSSGFGALEERGAGLDVAQLTAATEAAVYDAAVRNAFDVGPQLKLRLHPRLLPRTGGFEGGDAVDSTVAAHLLGSSLVLGVCEPRALSGHRAPVCDAPESGYVIRGSPVYRRGGDTIQFYMLSELHAVSETSGQEPFQFEMAYQLIPRDGDRWSVVAEGRVIQKQ